MRGEEIDSMQFLIQIANTLEVLGVVAMPKLVSLPLSRVELVAGVSIKY